MTRTAPPAYDPLDPDFLADPYAGYSVLRDSDPVHHHAKPEFWALSRFADVWEAVRDPATYSSASGLTFWEDEIGKLGLAPTIVMLDPPRHTQLRRLVGQAFSPRRVALLEDEIRAFVVARIDAMARATADGAPVDLHVDFSSPIPTFVLGRLLGVPEADRVRFDSWVQVLVELGNDGFALRGEMRGKEVIGEMFGYFTDAITRRSTEPSDDLLSALVAAEVDGERLSDWDILGFCFVLVAGGNDTTGNLISHGVQLLDEAPAQRELLLSDPSLTPGAVVEFLRLEGSVQTLGRTTTRPVRLHGVEIPEGVKVMLLYGAANRDEREFGPTAEQLDVRRVIPRQLGFAHGPHLCIGAHLAKLQARVAFEELLARQPHIGVDATRGQRLISSFTRGWLKLPATGVLHRNAE